MNINIESLDDATALRVLRTMARARPEEDVPDIDQLVQGLPQSTPGDVCVTQVRDADLARAALVWLAQDPQRRSVIEAIASGPAPASFAFDPSLGALACVLLLLKIKAVIERDKDGRWHFKAELAELKQGPLGVVLDLFAGLVKSR